MIILPSTYLPSVEHFVHIVQGDYIIDLGENFVKRSERNRANIMTANGLMQLTVNIRNANRPRTPMCRIEIDYSKRWQHQHWMAIISAYKSSPFFDHYADYLEPIFGEEYSSLSELNSAIMQLILKLLGIRRELNISQEYVVCAEGDCDLRPKGARSGIELEEYIQVFADRQPFAENLSIIDLIFNEGPNALTILQQASKR